MDTSTSMYLPDAWYMEHGGHGGPPMFPADASAQLTQVDEVVQPQRQRNEHPVPQGAPDVLPLTFEDGVWAQGAKHANHSIERVAK